MTKPEETNADAPTPEIKAPLEDLTDAIGAAFAAASLESDTISNPSQKFAPTNPISSMGRQVGPYKLLRQIGEGGMGTVWLAEQVRPVRRQVALKLIKPGAADSQMIARFEAERQALSMMDHPHIAKVLDVGSSEDGSPYFVMELVQGDPITQYCDTNKLTLNERLELFIQACDAVQHAHHKGIIHRDLKPSNMLVHVHNDKHTVKVIDFGLAKALEQAKLTDKTVLTEFGRVMGTVQYMSPEQAQLDSMDIDTRTDVYSLGVILYELLTGSTPIDKITLNDNALLHVLEMVREQSPPLPSNRLSSSIDKLDSISAMRKIQSGKLQQILKGELDWVVMRALEKDRARRYTTPNNLAADVRRYLDGDAVVARPPSASYRLRKFVRKNRVTVGLLAGLFTLLTGGAIAIASYAASAERARAKAVVARGDAEAAAERAETILTIVGSSFSATNPDFGAAEEMTAKEVLLNAKESVNDSELDEIGKIRLWNQLSRSFKGLGENELAIETGRLGYELALDTFGPEHVDSLDALSNLAFLTRVASRMDESIELYDQALKISTAMRGENHKDTLYVMHGLGFCYLFSGRTDKSLEFFERALRIGRTSLGPDEKEDLMFLASGLASACMQAGRVDEAIELSKEALQYWEKTLGPDDRRTIESQMVLAGSYVMANQIPEAIPIYEKTKQRLQSRLGADHPDVLLAVSGLADCFARERRFAEAIDLYQQAYQLQKDRLGPDHHNTLHSMAGLSYVYGADGQHAKAIELNKQVVELHREKFGSDHSATLKSMGSLALSHVLADDETKAVELYSQIYNTQVSKSGLGDPATQDTMYHLTWALATNEGMHSQLEEEFVKSMREACKLSQHGYHWLALAIAEYRLGNFTQATESANTSIGILPPPAHPINLAVKAMSHLKLGESAEADKFRQEMDKAMKSGAFDWDTNCSTFETELNELFEAISAQ